MAERLRRAALETERRHSAWLDAKATRDELISEARTAGLSLAEVSRVGLVSKARACEIDGEQAARADRSA